MLKPSLNLCLASALSLGGITRRAFSIGAAFAADPTWETYKGEGPGELKWYDVKVGDGAVPTSGQTVKMHYTGWLTDFDDLEGKFDSSYDRGRPLTFAVGTGRVIAGWDIAILKDMHVGTTRRVIIPPELGYGKRGAGGVIPPDATLYFEMKLLSVA